MNKLRRIVLSGQIESLYEWEKWITKIPFIRFPEEWMIQIIPPSGGAIARFRVRTPGLDESDWVSVYLDCYDLLGHFGEPYWEVYPYHGDVGRCAMADTQELLRMIADREPAAPDKED